MSKLKRLQKAYQLVCQYEEITNIKLDKQDFDNLSSLYLDTRYKSLEKLINAVICDLENRAFRDGEKLEEFLAIKWTRQALALIKQQVKAEYDKVMNKAKKEERKVSEDQVENFPDGVPLSN